MRGHLYSIGGTCNRKIEGIAQCVMDLKDSVLTIRGEQVSPPEA